MASSNGHSDENNLSEPMSGEQFAGYIERRLSLYEQIEPLNREGMVLRLRVRGQSIESDLTTFYEAYIRNPNELDTVVQTFVRVILGEVPARTEIDFNTLAERVYPMLKKIDLLVAVRERNLPMIVYREFLADLIITYVIDEQNSVSYINENHLEQWSISVQDLHEQAIENLRRRTQRVASVSAGEGEQRLFIFNTGDGYDASRLLLTDLLIGWARQLSGNLVIGIPNRDFLIAFSDSDQGILQNIAHQIQADSVQRERGLTEQLFTLSKGQIREYEWE
jgi:uncharacterized protein YtpQ (UPF0354 family)